MSTAIPDTHPIRPGFYFIDIQQAHVIASPVADIVSVTNDSGETLEKIFILSFSGAGYTIQHFTSKKYASVPHVVKGSIVHLSDKPAVWNIQKDGKGILRVVIPEQDLYWTETVVWGVRVFKLWGSDGKEDQMLTFKPFVENQ